MRTILVYFVFCSLTIQIYSQNATDYISKSNNLIEDNKYQEAFGVLSFGISAMPDSTKLYYNRGNLLEKMALYNMAIEDYNLGLDFSNTNEEKSKFNFAIGLVEYFQKDYQSSYEHLFNAYNLDTTNVYALSNLGAVTGYLNKKDEELLYLREIIKRRPNFPSGYINLGFYYQTEGKHEKAIKYFNRAIELAPDNELGYSNRSLSKLKLDDNDGAKKDINKSIDLNPKNSYAFKIRALIRIREGNLKYACMDLDKSIRLGYTEYYDEEVEKLIEQYCR
ncbi:tetratricopeptide repeat protein [Flagellimonas marinaquae]|uniref:tetratricopeptide repeat protein n=1 Tax=Flagellimonas aurea TaxID=2915619 RepID=UPI001CE042F4|nr:tetratricopeptide repeat protein [Allomuricauda aquimarina]